MRDLVRRRIAEGEKPEQIRSWLIERYGDWVSYRPSTSPIAWPLWAAPIVLLIFGGSIVAGRLKRRRS
jgi:cytochrome c-type biogenesis protein CcmH